MFNTSKLADQMENDIEMNSATVSAKVLNITPKVEDIEDFKKLSILMKPRCRSSRSVVWRFFGTLVYKDEACEPTVISNDSYCNLCFQEGHLHSYKYSSSSTNLQRHLITAHNISMNVDSSKVSTLKDQDYEDSMLLFGESRSEDFDNMDSKNISSTSRAMKDLEESSSTKSPVLVDQQSSIISNLAVMCCKDLLPFDIVEGEGFKQLLLNLEAVNYLLLPTSSSIRDEVLLNMFPEAMRKVSDIFKTSPSTLSVAVESQDGLVCSTFRYSKFKFYFCNEDFELVTLSLPLVIPGDVIVSNINLLEVFCTDYKLTEKTFFLVDESSPVDEKVDDVTEQPTQLHLEKYYCLIHSLNNLINVDGLSKNENYLQILREMNSHYELNQRPPFKSQKLLNAFKHLDQVVKSWTDLDNSKSNVKETLTQMPWYLLEPILEYIIKDLMNSKVPADLDDDVAHENVKSSLNNKLHDLKGLLSMFKKFSSAFEILNGSLNASCSLMLVLLLRVEIETILTTHADDESETIESIKRNMLASLKIRFPITDLHVCAALLDPSQRNLPSIREFLNHNQLTSVEFLSKMVKKYVKVNEADDEIENIKLNRKEAKVELVDLNSSSLAADVAPWKKMKLEILARQTNVSNQNFLEREIQKYICLFVPEDSANDDPLTWWKEQKKSLPKLSKLAKIILSLPAGCCNIRNVVKDENVCDKIQKLSLVGDDLKKFLFLHENFSNLST
ncbi:hypothetical protein HELRODRAFT_170589 [Helobdella robusta]|uniref:HAT C-terminal dimerisation domain-containing protein n=1 Tax=Helobdella robusta TaxID=6412 RepID=T1F377_HELRO|nr:hypothetical protein HELRODRAFT_170589 [Helobdella robusta]ESO07261.1 hypothetical protein HELRODRAFT_170589 [Helobdella robusta]